MRASPARIRPTQRPAHFMRAAYSGLPRIYVGPQARGLACTIWTFFNLKAFPNHFEAVLDIKIVQ